MALVYLDEGNQNPDELPWVNEFWSNTNEESSAFLVEKLSISSKGMLVITSHFKGFLFAQSTIYEQLLEALDLWVENAAVAFPLFVVVKKGGKLSYAIDADLEPVIWLKDKKTYVQKAKGKPEAGIVQPKKNPFLVQSPPTPTKSKASQGTSSHSKMTQ